MAKIEREEQYNSQSRFEIQKRSAVLDPLESIIEGENRHERYKNFKANVLGAIWPQDKNSGEYGADLWRALRWEKGDISGYTHSTPMARDPSTVTPEQFENMVANVGSDYLRVMLVPPQLLQPTTIIPVGGSCAIETWGMRNIENIQTGIKKGILPKEFLADAARKMVNIAPTITHISGAILSGQDASVHLLETGMWAERLTSYGIPEQETESLTDEAYKRINQAVARRAKLINPNAAVIPVNFDELPLKEAVGEWHAAIGTPYDPTYRLSEVAYTYDGPRQKELLLNALRNKIQNGNMTPEEKRAIITLVDAQYHVQLKQIDHLRWESMGLPDEVITGRREMTPREKEKYENQYVYRMMTDTLTDVYKRHTTASKDVISVGFADLPYNTSVQHETRDVGLIFRGSTTNGNDSKSIAMFRQSLEKSLDPNNPVRLHRLNIDAHLAFLRSHFRENEFDTQPKEVRDWIVNFPLSKNPFVVHSMDHRYDKDFNLFLINAVVLQTARSNGIMERQQANQEMRRLTAGIYPKLEANIDYRFGRSRYA